MMMAMMANYSSGSIAEGDQGVQDQGGGEGFLRHENQTSIAIFERKKGGKERK